MLLKGNSPIPFQHPVEKGIDLSRHRFNLKTRLALSAEHTDVLYPLDIPSYPTRTSPFHRKSPHKLTIVTGSLVRRSDNVSERALYSLFYDNN